MNIQVKSSNGITLVPSESRLLANRQVIIEGEINSTAACEFAKEILILMNEDRSKPIDVLINSPGGEITAGLLMYDIICSLGNKIRCYCIGRAYSMGAVLFASGGGGRYILPNSELMIHQPLISSGIGGNASSIKSISDSLIDSKDRLNAILAKHTGQPIGVIEEATRYDHYFNPEESVSFGLADKIVDFSSLWRN